MSSDVRSFSEGQRVRAVRRAQFPAGTVLRRLENGFVLVRWDGDVLETAHESELTLDTPDGASE